MNFHQSKKPSFLFPQSTNTGIMKDSNQFHSLKDKDLGANHMQISHGHIDENLSSGICSPNEDFVQLSEDGKKEQDGNVMA